MSQFKTLADVWDDPSRPWPSVVYIETTNRCNAHCLSCLNHACRKTRGIMDMDTFKSVCAIIADRGLKIHAMFCFGEPLLDQTLTSKYAYAQRVGVLRLDHCGLNTNVSMLTPDRYDGILQHTPNITLSFFNVGSEFERLTGLSWDLCYGNALRFLEYREIHAINYPVAIGVNKVQGYDLDAVKRAFDGCRVNWAQDAEIRWAGPTITGVIDRTIMYPWWRCDGYKGALQVKWNGDCEFCAYDIIGTESGVGETHVGNLFTDSWETICQTFRDRWRAGCSLCARCDYWHRGDAVISNDSKKPDPIPSDWYDWQLPLLKEDESVRD